MKKPTGPKREFYFVELHNKSRQGLYLHIRSKGGKGHYYKVNPEEPIDPIIKYHEDRHEKHKPKGSLRAYRKTYARLASKERLSRKERSKPLTRQADRYVKKIQQRKPIKDLLKTGLGTSTIKNALTATNKSIQYALQQALGPLVLDKGLLNILTTHQNLQKIADRLEHRIKLHGKETELGNSTIFKKTTQQVIQELQNNFKKGEEVDDESPNNTGTKLKNLGYQEYQKTTKGKLHSIEVQIIFRKG